MHRVHNDDKNQRYTRKRWRRKEVPREDAKESAHQQEQYQVICAKQRASTAEPESVTQGNLCVGIHSVGL